MYKILILAYLIGQDPVSTMQTFELDAKFGSMSECKKELTLQLPDGRYEVINEFIIDQLTDRSKEFLVRFIERDSRVFEGIKYLYSKLR